MTWFAKRGGWRNVLMLGLLLGLASQSAKADLWGGPLAPQPQPSPTFRADDFFNFIGLSAAPFDRYLSDGPFKGAGTHYPPEMFFDLGVRHYRTGLKNDLTLPDAPTTVHTLTLQKHTGEYFLLIWNEVVNFDSQSKREIHVAPVAVKVQFSTPVESEATCLTQNAQGEYQANKAAVSGNALQLQVPSSVMIVRLTPSLVAGKPLAPPQSIEVKTTESQVELSWQAVENAAGYFVLRSGFHVGTVTQTHFTDASSWLRPGLGYSYEIQAYDAKGNLSLPAAVVAKTADKFPDLIVTELRTDPANPSPDQKIRMFAKLKNIGAGATPPHIQAGVTWSVDGKVVAWHTQPGPMRPGQEWELISDEGPGTQGQWTATAGAHVLKCVVDDINRLPGEWKDNIVRDVSFIVGPTGKGRIEGATQAAPGEVDLTRQGTLDWIHWGLDGKESVQRKMGRKNLFGPLTASGQGYMDATIGCPVSIRWSDGQPKRQVDDTHWGLWWNNVNYAQSFTVVADTQPRVLKLYVAGINGAAATLTAKLSDDSAPPYVSDSWNGNFGNGNWAACPGAFSAEYTIMYQAASPDQKLMVEWKLSGEPTRFTGQARLQAATLSRP